LYGLQGLKIGIKKIVDPTGKHSEMNDLIETYTIYLSNGTEALAAFVMALAAAQATCHAVRLFLVRPPEPEQPKVEARLRLGR
jgi:hypothetical protein